MIVSEVIKIAELVSKKCLHCGNTFEVKQFPKNSLCKDNYECYCRKCKKTQVVTKELLIDYLKMNEIAFNEVNWKASFEWAKERELKKHKDGLPENFNNIVEKTTISKYFQQCNITGDFEHSKLKKEKRAIKKTKNKKNKIEITEDLIEKWGEGYESEEYILFEKKYNRLIRSYKEKTEMHSESLLIYIRYRVKEEMATAKGDVKEAKLWGELASKAAQDAKINPSQMSKSDISGGIDVISQLFEAVESEVGIIPLLPKLLEQPYDDADMIIWCIINYIRRLEEKPTVKYRDIYVFYDEMLKEHYKQNGFNNEQIENYLKKRNNVFRDMEEVYIEPLYSKNILEEDQEGDE